MPASTPTDLCEIACNSSADRFPAPGMVRSMRYLFMQSTIARTPRSGHRASALFDPPRHNGGLPDLHHQAMSDRRAGRLRPCRCTEFHQDARDMVLCRLAADEERG